MFLIIRRFGTTVDALLRLNPGIDPNRLFPGQQILIPAPVVPPGCIVYVSTRTGQPELWRSNGAGEGAVQITRGSGTARQPVSDPKWAPDGRRIAYQVVGRLFVIDPCGRRPVLLASNVYNYSWSNDSSRIVSPVRRECSLRICRGMPKQCGKSGLVSRGSKAGRFRGRERTSSLKL